MTQRTTATCRADFTESPLAILRVQRSLRMSQVLAECLVWGRGPKPHTNQISHPR
jgi:hypothetical protein